MKSNFQERIIAILQGSPNGLTSRRGKCNAVLEGQELRAGKYGARMYLVHRHLRWLSSRAEVEAVALAARWLQPLIVAATNKCLAQSNKSSGRGKAT